jgi:hypothetical protein
LPLPLEIARHTAGFTLHYEEFGANRIVLLDGAAPSHPNHPHPFGVSKGRLEDDGTLVVETRGIPTGKLYDWFGGGPHSAELRATERYTVDGDWLRLELTLDDPQTFREPLVLSKSWRRTHGTAIARYGCDVMAGELDNVFADYVDPRTLDARRGL